MSIVIICFFTSVLPCFCFANYHINDFKNIRIGGVFHNAETKNSFLVSLSGRIRQSYVFPIFRKRENFVLAPLAAQTIHTILDLFR